MNYIKQWRKHRQLTLEQLAERVDMTSSNISSIERRATGYSWSSLEDIAEALDCSAADLLSGPPGATTEDWRSEWNTLDPKDRIKAVEILKLMKPDGPNA